MEGQKDADAARPKSPDTPTNDGDLQKAIALSLQDSGAGSSSHTALSGQVSQEDQDISR